MWSPPLEPSVSTALVAPSVLDATVSPHAIVPSRSFISLHVIVTEYEPSFDP